MGWLEGLLTGYAGTLGDIRKENARQAELSASREGDIYKTLLSSEDPEVRGMAATGLLQSAQPGKLKSGFGGWMGQMQANPMYPQLMKYISTPKQVGEDVTTTTTTPQQAGFLPTLPDTSKPAALPETKTTTPGAPGPQPVQPTPAPGPPPPPAGIAATAPGAAGASTAPPGAAPGASPVAGPPPPPPSIGQLGPDQLRGALPPSAAAPESLTQTKRTPIMALPHAFPTAEESEIAAARAKGLGEFQYLADIGRRSGQPNPEAWAANLIAQDHARRAAGASPYRLQQIEWTDDNGQLQRGWGSYNQSTGHLQDGDGNPLPQNAHVLGSPAKPSTRALNKYEEVAARLFGSGAPDEDPVQLTRHLSPPQRERVEHEVAIYDAQAALQRANTVADAGLNRSAKANLEEKLATHWQTIQKPQLEMQRGVQDMQAALSRFNADPNGASQAIVTTFEKILNPTSMVRQQAYERTPSYLGLDQKIQGLWERYAGRVNPETGQWVSGGPGIPLDELKELAETARQFLVVQAQNNVGEQQRIAQQIRNNGLDSRTVFGNTVSVPGRFGDPTSAPTSAPVTPVVPAAGGGAPMTGGAPGAEGAADPAEVAAAQGKGMYLAPSGNVYINGKLTNKPPK